MPPNFMTPKQSAEFAETPRAFGKDGSGFLEAEELGTVLASIGRRYSHMQLQEVVDYITGGKDSARIDIRVVCRSTQSQPCVVAPGQATAKVRHIRCRSVGQDQS